MQRASLQIKHKAGQRARQKTDNALNRHADQTLGRHYVYHQAIGVSIVVEAGGARTGSTGFAATMTEIASASMSSNGAPHVAQP